jgi:hypothetical protein
MLTEGRIPHTSAEGEAIDTLLARHKGNATLTRRDPGETGPMIVHIGDNTWEVTAEGKVTKQRKAKG